MLTNYDIILDTFDTWATRMEDEIGEHVYMDIPSTISSFPTATMYFMGLPTAISDLSGNELGVMVTLQLDIYTSGSKALSRGYELDEISNNEMLELGYHRIYGPELIQQTSDSIKRLTSRYERLIGRSETII